MRAALPTAVLFAAAAAVPAAGQTARATSGDAVAIARPGEVIVGGSGARQRLSCDRGTAFVGGERNIAEITGACDRLVVGGSRNEVRVRLAPGAQVNVGGTGNRVIWTLAGDGAPPQVVTGGEANVVERGR